MAYNFHTNQVIRHRDTKKLYLLLFLSKSYWLVVDLTDHEIPQILKVVLYKDIKNFVPDYEVECTETWQHEYWKDTTLEFHIKRTVAI